MHNVPCGQRSPFLHNWYGVTCADGHVVRLELNGNGLRGTIPDELGDLTKLQALYLNNNQLTGPIPDTLGSLTDLQVLHLYDNQLTDPIPPELGGLANLQSLWLWGNRLDGTIPTSLRKLTKLQSLWLSNNQLSGSIPPELGELVNLEGLGLEMNQLDDHIPATLCTFKNASADFADFGYNKLSATNACINAIDPDWAQTQTVPPTAVQATSVNQLNWTPIPYWADGGYYQVGYATTTNGPYTFMDPIGNKSTPGFTVKNLTPGTYYFVVRTFTPQHFTPANGQQQNDLTSDNSAEVTVSVVFDCANVSEIPKSECDALVALYTSTNGNAWTTKTGWLATNTPCSWFGITCAGGHVQALVLGNNRLSGAIPPELGDLTKLQSLVLGNNQLSGSIPSKLGTLAHLSFLQLNSNQLNGEIPLGLGTLANLSFLQLNSNQLSGEIPPNLGTMTSLEVIDLSNNQLSGRIPTALCSTSVDPSYAEPDFGYNKLSAADPCIDVLDNDWAQTQTVPPTNVNARLVGQQVQLQWSAILYREYSGYYEVGYATTQNGPYTFTELNRTTDRSTGIILVTGPTTPDTYYFVVRTFTYHHDVQQNDLTSDNSAEVVAIIPCTGSGICKNSEIAGKVQDENGQPLVNAWVNICTLRHVCRSTGTNALGEYAVSSLEDGQYTVTAVPSANSIAIPSMIGPLTLLKDQVLLKQNIILYLPDPLPPGTTITGSYTNPDGMQVAYLGVDLPLVTHGCAGGTATYQITQAFFGAAVLRNGPMSEAPAGTYTAIIPMFDEATVAATVSIAINCPDGTMAPTTFTLYIDPSGYVRTVEGAPIAGATVTLYRSDSAAGPFEIVPNGDAIMAPMNRQNPDTTNATGHFGWDVIAGYYFVRAAAPGCTAPGNSLQAYVDSAVLIIPPPVINLDLRLACPTVNTLPVAANQSITTAQGTSISIILTGSDANGDALTYTIVTPPQLGTGTLSGTAPNVTYTPAPGFTGDASFTFQANDGKDDSNVAIVTVHVTAGTPVNKLPVAANQTVEMQQGTSKLIVLTGSDADGDALTYKISTPLQGSTGTLSGTAPNVTYTPPAGFVGDDSFTFQANDGKDDSNVATVTIHVTAGTPALRSLYLPLVQR